MEVKLVWDWVTAVGEWSRAGLLHFLFLFLFSLVIVYFYFYFLLFLTSKTKEQEYSCLTGLAGVSSLPPTELGWVGLPRNLKENRHLYKRSREKYKISSHGLLDLQSTSCGFKTNLEVCKKKFNPYS